MLQFQLVDIFYVVVAILLYANDVILHFRSKASLQILLTKLNEFALQLALKSICLRLKL